MDLYIFSADYDEFATPRAIVHWQKKIIDSKDVLCATLAEAIIGQKYGLKDYMVKEVYLINRHVGESATNLDSLPIHVHVLIPQNIENLKPSKLSELQNIAWAELHNGKEGAE